MTWPSDEQRAALGPSTWEMRDRVILDVTRDGAEAEARALAWASSAIGTAYGDTSVWTGVGSGAVPEPLYQLDGTRRQL